jgi:virginiamycin B lyase
MHRYLIFAIALLAIGCSSHSGSIPAPTKILPEIYQKHPLNNGWTKTAIPDFNGKSSGPQKFAVDANHKVWVTDAFAGGISKIAMDQHVTTYPLSIAAYAIALGSDQNFWVTTFKGGVVARVTPEGVETDFPVAPANADMFSITAGPDGALWFTECEDFSTGGIGRITTSGTYTLYPTGCAFVVTSGPDGNIWFDNDAASISKMSPQGVVLGTYDVGDNFINDIAAGPDGALYATGETKDPFHFDLVKVTTNGTVTHYGAATFPDGAAGITNGPDGNLWISLSTPPSHHLVTFDPVTKTFGPKIKSPASGFLTVGPDDDLWVQGWPDAVYTYVLRAITLGPRPVTVSVGHTADLTVSETNYTGQWTALVSKPTIATITPDSSNGTFVVTGIAPGTTRITVYDSMFNSSNVRVTVQ